MSILVRKSSVIGRCSGRKFFIQHRLPYIDKYLLYVDGNFHKEVLAMHS